MSLITRNALLFSGIFLLSCMLPCPSSLASSNNGYYSKDTGPGFSFFDAMARYGTPSVDGRIGADEWDLEQSRSVYKYDRDDNRIRYTFQHDAVNFYLLIEVDDDNIWDDTPGQPWHTNRDDGIEIYIDPDNSRDSLLMPSDRVIAFTVTGKGYRFDRGNGKGSTEYYNDISEIRKAVAINGTVNSPSDTDTGYVAEISIPWAHLGGAPPVTGFISLNIIIVEDDDGGPLDVKYDETRWDTPFEIDRYFKWFGDGLNGPANYARIYLSGASDTAPPSAVTDLAVKKTTPFSATISFTAPGDNGTAGEASKYEIRYTANGPIATEAKWNEAVSFKNSFLPKISGKKETFRITGLSPETSYHIGIRAVDAAGNMAPISQDASITTTPASSGYGRGRIFPSPAGRFFIYEDGTRFLPVSEPAGITWLGIRDLYQKSLWDDTYEKLINWSDSIEEGFAQAYIESLSKKGVNLIRIFIEDLAFAHPGNPYAPEQGVSYLEFPATASGDNYIAETLRFLESFMTLCGEHGIYVVLTPFDTYFYRDYWDYNPYNINNGGPIGVPDEFITSPAAVESQKKRLNVLNEIVKKHSNFFGWEMVNEWDNDTFASQPGGWEDLRISWVKDLLGYLRSIDDNSMIFVSSVIWQPQFELKDFLLAGDYFDFVCIHNYTKAVKDPTASGDPDPTIRPALDSRRLVQYMTGNTVDFRPVFDLEFGPISLESHSDEYSLVDDEETFHNIIWAEFAAGAAGMALRWPGKTLENKGPRLSEGMLDYQENMAAYFKASSLPFRDLDTRPWERHVDVAGPGDIKAFASSNGRSGLVYLLHDLRSSGGELKDTVLTVSGLKKDGRYRVEIWDTRSSTPSLAEQTVNSADGKITITLPPFTGDIFTGFTLIEEASPIKIKAPNLSVKVSGIHADISWTLPSGAEGVLLYYAPADLSHIGNIDMGSVTALSLDLFKGFDYYILAVAYGADGSKGMESGIERITIP